MRLAISHQMTKHQAFMRQKRVLLTVTDQKTVKGSDTSLSFTPLFPFFVFGTAESVCLGMVSFLQKLKTISEEQQGPTLGVHFKEVSALSRGKEYD